jgi:hypothetical protein
MCDSDSTYIIPMLNDAHDSTTENKISVLPVKTLLIASPMMVLPSDCMCIILENIISIDGKPTCTFHKYLHMFRNDKIIIKHLLRLIFKKYGEMYNLPFDTLEQRLEIATKIVRKKSLKHYPYHKNFKSGERFKILDLPAKTRKILYFMSLAYGYIWYSKTTDTFDSFGYRYSDIFDGYSKSGITKNSILTGKFLKIHKIDNLEHYDVIEDAKNELDIKYRLKKDEHIYKCSVTKHWKEMDFVPL